MEEIGKILPTVVGRQMGRGDSRLVEMLTPLWARAVGKGIAQNCRPMSFVSGTLTVATGCSCWAAQLRQMSEEVRAGVNSFLGKPLVKKLRVRQVTNLTFDQGRSELEARGGRPDEAALAPLNSKPDLDLSNLDPEIARTVERSFAKYFSRRGARDLEN